MKGSCTVEYFCTKYCDLLKYTLTKMDKLQEEFVDYQLLVKSDISESVWEEALVYNDELDEKQYY